MTTCDGENNNPLMTLRKRGETKRRGKKTTVKATVQRITAHPTHRANDDDPHKTRNDTAGTRLQPPSLCFRCHLSHVVGASAEASLPFARRNSARLRFDSACLPAYPSVGHSSFPALALERGVVGTDTGIRIRKGAPPRRNDCKTGDRHTNFHFTRAE
ncbi:unnamed protein product [Soboliphyme baturini]|uniref:Uncharacterized protein n=1 Tax=Soboliphyme baturini TaxID=241478 RepID=A0A183IHJ2_9BILA|nr:unnamed protein product [Soboliphyme baturini]